MSHPTIPCLERSLTSRPSANGDVGPTAHVSRRGADLRGVDLTGTRFSFIDLAHAQLDRANLSGARFEFVDLSGASLTDARASGAHFESCSLSGAHLERVVLDHAMVRNVSLERADLTGASLRFVCSTACLFDYASLRDSDLQALVSVDTSFTGAELAGARNFSRSREILCEILSREIDADFEQARSVGAILVGRSWCWDAWAGYLSEHSDQ
jgi:uncharacterized protein YjbI with pentapeptide repeats